MIAERDGSSASENGDDAIRVGRPVSAAIGDCQVWDAQGATHRLAEAWDNGAALVVFIRHFECAACSINVTDLSPRIGELAQLGVATTLVGCGPHEVIEDFVNKFGLTAHRGLRVWTDPTLATHKAMQLKHGVMLSWGPRAAWNFLKILGKGHWQSGFAGDGSQQGGAMLVTEAGRIAYYRRSERLGDFARAVDLVEAAMTARLEALQTNPQLFTGV